MPEESTSFAIQTRQRLITLLELLEQDKASLSSAGAQVEQSGAEVYGKFIDELHRALDNLDATVEG